MGNGTQLVEQFHVLGPDSFRLGPPPSQRVKGDWLSHQHTLHVRHQALNVGLGALHGGSNIAFHVEGEKSPGCRGYWDVAWQDLASL